LTSYENRPKWHEASCQEVLLSLTPLEQKLATSMDLVQVRGKCGRKVPILIPEDCQVAMNLLAAHRNEHISASNPYFFANAGK